MAQRDKDTIIYPGVILPTYNITKYPNAGSVSANFILSGGGASTSGLLIIDEVNCKLYCSRSGQEGTFRIVNENSPNGFYVRRNSDTADFHVTFPYTWFKEGFPWWYVEFTYYGRTSSNSRVQVGVSIRGDYYFAAYNVPLDPPIASLTGAKQGDIVRNVNISLTGTDEILEDPEALVGVSIYAADSPNGDYALVTSVMGKSAELNVDLRTKLGDQYNGKYVKFEGCFQDTTGSTSSNQYTTYVQMNYNDACNELSVPAPNSGGQRSMTTYNDEHFYCQIKAIGDTDGIKQTYNIKVADRKPITVAFNTSVEFYLDKSEVIVDGEFRKVKVTVTDSLGEGSGENEVTIAYVSDPQWGHGARLSEGDIVTATSVNYLQNAVRIITNRYFGPSTIETMPNVQKGDLVKADVITEMQDTIDAILNINHFVTRPNWITVKKGDKISAAPLNQLREIIEQL